MDFDLKKKTMNNVKNERIITDLSQLELPEYIDKPEYVRHKTVGYSLIGLGWICWMWLFMPLLTLGLWWFEGRTAIHQLAADPVTHGNTTLGDIAILVACFIVSLFIWASYNWIRFKGNERRTAPKEVKFDELAASFEISPVAIHTLSSAKNITLYYSIQGKLVEFSVNDPLEIPTLSPLPQDVLAQSHRDNTRYA